MPAQRPCPQPTERSGARVRGLGGERGLDQTLAPPPNAPQVGCRNRRLAARILGWRGEAWRRRFGEGRGSAGPAGEGRTRRVCVGRGWLSSERF